MEIIIYLGIAVVVCIRYWAVKTSSKDGKPPITMGY
jgi:hypothetical protein